MPPLLEWKSPIAPMEQTIPDESYSFKAAAWPPHSESTIRPRRAIEAVRQESPTESYSFKAAAWPPHPERALPKTTRSERRHSRRTPKSRTSKGEFHCSFHDAFRIQTAIPANQRLRAVLDELIRERKYLYGNISKS